jgi:hypothetical protein
MTLHAKTFAARERKAERKWMDERIADMSPAMTIPEQAVEAAPFKPLSKTPGSLDADQNFAQSRAVLVMVPPELHQDTKHLVQCFAEELARKLRRAETDYEYSDGWLTDEWQADCLADLHKHIAKGDPRDVAIYCAFMWARGWPTAALPLVGVQRPAEPKETP